MFNEQGFFIDYQLRMGKSPDTVCRCCNEGVHDSIGHTLWDCVALENLRAELE